MYLLFGPQSNRLGLFFFSLHTAADDLDTTAETLRKALADVATTFGWHFDADARVFLCQGLACQRFDPRCAWIRRPVSEGLDDLSKTEALGGLNLALAEGRTH